MGILTSLQIGRRGLSAASTGIDVTAQNVNNATTTGYSRKVLSQATLNPISQKGLWVGQGVDLTGIQRMSDRLLGVQLVQATGDNERATALESALKVTEAYFNEAASTGLVEAYDGFFDALSAASADPSDDGLREAAVSAAATLASVVSRTATGVTETLAGFDEETADGMDTLNDQLKEIASLNGKIEAGGGAAASGDLLDRRDQLLLEVSQTTGATAELNADGQAVVYLGGNAIVSGDKARTLSVETDSDGVPQVFLSANASRLRVTDDVSGAMGGIISARSSTQGYLDTLDTFASTFAAAVNAQHAAGFDANGAAGGDIFTGSGTIAGSASSLTIDAALAGDPSLFALAGDSTALAGDASNLEALQGIEADTSLFSGNTGHTLLSNLVTTVGSNVSAASNDASSTLAILSDLQSVRDAVSSVDTDEEALKLIEYQAAYRASTSLISTVNTLLQDLLSMGR